MQNNYPNILKLSIIIVGLFFYGNFAFAEALNLPKDSEGWTIFTPSDDSRIMYVSTDGNDSTGAVYDDDDAALGGNPFSPTGPINSFATYASAYANTRSGYPDWILFRRGDIFSEGIGSSLHNGRGATEPFLISSYGNSGNLPVLKTTSGPYVMNSGRWMAFSGLDFYASSRDYDSPDFVSSAGGKGFNIYISPGSTAEGFLIEGCKFRFFRNNLNFTNAGNEFSGLTIRRNTITDSYCDTGQGHCQGMWADHVDYLVLEENIFDHNGWYMQRDPNTYPNDTDAHGQATIFNHNAYVTSLTNATYIGNMFLRASSIGNKFTTESTSSNVTIDNNLYVDGELGMSLGYNNTIEYKLKNFTVQNNVLTNLGRSQPTKRTLGWGIQAVAFDVGTISNNYIINQPLDVINNTFGIEIMHASRDVDITNNVIHNIKSAFAIRFSDDNGDQPLNITNYTISGNKIQQPDVSTARIVSAPFDTNGRIVFSDNKYYSVGQATPFTNVNAMTFSAWQTSTGDNSTFEEFSFPDDTRNIETYQASINETATINAFVANARMQDRYNWDPRYTAPVVNAWIKAGFTSSDTAAPSAPHGLAVQ